MPTVFSHAVVAGAMASLHPRAGSLPARFWALSVLCAVLPDGDVIVSVFGIPYSSVYGHRGFIHSLAFAAVWGTAVAVVAFREYPRRAVAGLAAYFAFVTASHGILDAMTDGGRGIALFWPFDDTRYFFPWRPIRVSPIGTAFFSMRGVRVMVSEFTWLWLPSLLVIAAARFARRPVAGSR
jgi:inner membrane protein